METKTIKICFVGDIMCEAIQIPACEEKPGKYNFMHTFSDIKEYFHSCDYVIANLETPIAGKEMEYAFEKYSFNAPEDFALALKDCGVDLVSTANNHCLDRGVKGLAKTVSFLDKIGIAHIGTYIQKNTNRCFIKKYDDLRIGFMSYTYGTNAFFNQVYLRKKERYMVNLLQEQELCSFISRIVYGRYKGIVAKVLRRILIRTIRRNCGNIYECKERSHRHMKKIRHEVAELKKHGADFIIMYMHAGGQYNDKPSKYILKLSDRLMSFGINAIIGNHEHVIHGSDLKKVEDGCIKIFSLGNFSGISGVLNAPFDKRSEYSILFNLYLSKENRKVIINKCTFSVMKNILHEKEKIKTVFLYDLIVACKNHEEKAKLYGDNLWAVNTFCCTKHSDIPLLMEYDMDRII